MTSATCSPSSLSAGCTMVNSGFTSCRLARPAMYEPIAPMDWSGVLNALPIALSRSPGCCSAESATRARRISLVPSKIMLMRASRTNCSYGYSLE